MLDPSSSPDKSEHYGAGKALIKIRSRTAKLLTRMVIYSIMKVIFF
jgi:hypothetical protein